jgi:hypothetical protein
MQTLGIGLLMKTEVFTKLEGRRGEEVWVLSLPFSSRNLPSPGILEDWSLVPTSLACGKTKIALSPVLVKWPCCSKVTQNRATATLRRKTHTVWLQEGETHPGYRGPSWKVTPCQSHSHPMTTWESNKHMQNLRCLSCIVPVGLPGTLAHLARSYSFWDPVVSCWDHGAVS